MKNTDPIFAAYAATAPRLDLAFYLRYAEGLAARYQLAGATKTILGEMVNLECAMAGLADTHPYKDRVWRLIDRFKASIPGWCGNAGVSSIANRGKHQVFALGAWPYTSRRKAYDRYNAPRTRFKSRADAHACYAYLFKQIDAYDRKGTALEPRERALTSEQVHALFHAAASTLPVLEPPKKQSVNWRSRALAAEARVAELERAAAPTQTTRTPRPKTASSTSVDWVSAGRKAWETRQRNLAAKRATEGAAA